MNKDLIRFRLLHGLSEKFKESLLSVAPIIVIVLVLGFTIVPVPISIMICFLMGAVLLVLGMMFFTTGAEMSMTPIGEQVGAGLIRSRNIVLILIVTFVAGITVTIAEPDLAVLAEQVPQVPNIILIVAVALGVGLFLMLSILRMILGIPLRIFLLIFYVGTFILAAFVPKDFLAVAFDSGGVTTGPMTVPFIIALGVGVSAIRSDKRAEDDSFGLVALASVGPIIAVMILSLLYSGGDVQFVPHEIASVDTSVEATLLFISGFPIYFVEMAQSLLPVPLFYFVFIIFDRGHKRNLPRILLGLAYTYIGLVLFMTGVNMGFMQAGQALGELLGDRFGGLLLIPIAMIIGYFVVKAEPAVYVLTHQVEDITDGEISAKTVGRFLSIGVAVSLGLAAIRVITGISILWFLLPGYATAIIISFFVPKIYTAIAFDSGGVASGPMTAAFVLPFAQGASIALGGNVVTDAFGVVAMVAMTPLITIQIMGLAAKIRQKRQIIPAAPEPILAVTEFDDNSIIEL